MDIYYDMTRQIQVDASGARSASRPLLRFKEQPVWTVHFVDEANHPLNLNSIPSWRAAVDRDLKSTTEVMCRTLNDKIDKNRLAEGIVDVRLDANTTTFLEAVDGKDAQAAYFELWGYDANGVKQIYFRLAITASAVVDPEGGTPPAEPDSGLVEKTELEALVSRKLVYEYSADGTEAHSKFVIHVDKYQRVRHGASGEPSEWQLIPYGTDGRVVEPKLVAPLAERPETAAEGFCFCDSDSGNLYWLIAGAWTPPVHITTLQGAPGRDGRNGEPGRDGKDGKDGTKGNEGKQGKEGLVGPAGQGLWIDKTDILARRHIYDSAEANFKYLATDLFTDETDGRHYQCWYQKKSNGLGDWSAGIRLYLGIQGPQGQPGKIGPQGQPGENASIVPDYIFTQTEVYGGALLLDGIRPIAQVELYNSEGAGVVLPVAKEPGVPDCCAIRTCYGENHTIIYLGTLDATLGGRIRFAQGMSGQSSYQMWLSAGYEGTQTDYLNWMRGKALQIPVTESDLVENKYQVEPGAVVLCAIDPAGIEWKFEREEVLHADGKCELNFSGVKSRKGITELDGEWLLIVNGGKGDDGKAATIREISAEYVAGLNEPVATNLGTETDARIHFQFPRSTGSADGHTHKNKELLDKIEIVNGWLCYNKKQIIKVEGDEPQNTMYYGYVTSAVLGSTVKAVEITKAMLSASANTVTSKAAAELSKTSLGTIPAGSIAVVMLPRAAQLRARKFDGISDYVAFELNNGAAGTGANGAQKDLDGVLYDVYGEFKLTTAELFIKVEKGS